MCASVDGMSLRFRLIVNNIRRRYHMYVRLLAGKAQDSAIFHRLLMILRTGCCQDDFLGYIGVQK